MGCYFFSISSQRQHFLLAANPWHSPRRRPPWQPKQHGGMVQCHWFNWHLGVSGFIWDGVRVCSHQGLRPPRMQLGRRQEASTTQAFRYPALAGAALEIQGGRGEQHMNRQTDPAAYPCLSKHPLFLQSICIQLLSPSLGPMILHSRNKAEGRNCSFHPPCPYQVSPQKLFSCMADFGNTFGSFMGHVGAVA